MRKTRQEKNTTQPTTWHDKIVKKQDKTHHEAQLAILPPPSEGRLQTKGRQTQRTKTPTRARGAEKMKDEIEIKRVIIELFYALIFRQIKK